MSQEAVAVWEGAVGGLRERWGLPAVAEVGAAAAAAVNPVPD